MNLTTHSVEETLDLYKKKIFTHKQHPKSLQLACTADTDNLCIPSPLLHILCPSITLNKQSGGTLPSISVLDIHSDYICRYLSSSTCTTYEVLWRCIILVLGVMDGTVTMATDWCTVYINPDCLAQSSRK